MKRKIFVAVILMALGGASPKIWDRAVTWMTAPPAQPRQEAQKLIASLEDSEGWRVVGKDSSNSCNPKVYKGHVEVAICTWHADIRTNGVNCNSTFTWGETAAINDAAEKCLQKLTTKALDATAGK